MTKTLRRPAAVRIEWPRRPTRRICVFGRRQTWRSRDGRYTVDRYMDSTGCYIACCQTPVCVISTHRTLRAAQRACEKHARKRETRSHENEPQMDADGRR